MTLAKDIKNHMKAEVKKQMEILKSQCEEELRNIIEAKVYSRPEGKYKRTMQLLNSVTSSDVEIRGNTISFKVYLDPAKMHHWSLVGEEAKSIAPGEEVYVPPLVEYTHYGLYYRKGTPFMEHFYKEVEKYVKEIEDDLNIAMLKFFEKKSYKK